MNRDFKGIWIPKEIWLNKELTLQEKVMFIEIDSLDNKDGCFASNAYFSEFFDISKSRVSQIIKSLKEKGFIKLELIYKGKEVEKRVLNILNKGIKYSKEGIKENAKGYLESCEDNNTYNNTFMFKNADEIFLDYREKYKEYATQLIRDKVWLESIGRDFMNGKSKIVVGLTTRKYLELFLNRLDQDKKIHNNKRDFMSHFTHWLRKQTIVFKHPPQEKIIYG